MKEKALFVLFLVAIAIAAGCVSKEPEAVGTSNVGQITEKNAEYFAVNAIPPNVQWSPGVILSTVRVEGKYIIAFFQNSKTETADVGSVYASFRDADGNYAGNSIPEYYAGISEWDKAIVGWKIQKIQPSVRWKIRIEIPENAAKVSFN